MKYLSTQKDTSSMFVSSLLRIFIDFSHSAIRIHISVQSPTFSIFSASLPFSIRLFDSFSK